LWRLAAVGCVHDARADQSTPPEGESVTAGISAATDAVEGPALEAKPFWNDNQPGFRFTDQPLGTPAFFSEVEAHRYALEPHIPGFARFWQWTNKDVLEAGCGIGTDGLQFARAGARYTGYDQSDIALGLAQRRFEQEGRRGRFVQGSVEELPFEDASFDLVYSFGVIHVTHNTDKAVDEFHRVLRPGGTALVMVYNRGSLNYYSIAVVRRALAGLLMIPGAPGMIAKITRERRDVLDGQRELLRKHGLRYLTDLQLFLSNNTDGPGNPLTKVYRREGFESLFSDFSSVRSSVDFLNLRIYPGGDRLARTGTARRMARRWGWHLCTEARK
jgi:SAM-dependent methyltransferase